MRAQHFLHNFLLSHSGQKTTGSCEKDHSIPAICHEGHLLTPPTVSGPIYPITVCSSFSRVGDFGREGQAPCSQNPLLHCVCVYMNFSSLFLTSFRSNGRGLSLFFLLSGSCQRTYDQPRLAETVRDRVSLSIRHEWPRGFGRESEA